MKITSYDII